MTTTKTSVENNENKNNNENNCSSTNKKISNSLMKKTKNELLNIIFRKDDVEQRLNNTLNILTEDYINLHDRHSKLEISFDALNNKYEYLFSDYSNLSDNYATLLCEGKHKINKLKIILLLSFMINILFIINIILNLIL